MNATTISVIFDAKLIPSADLTMEAELALIVAAQGGDQDAYVTLLRQYAHGLRGLAKSEYARAGGTVEHEETRANVLLAFAEALAKCDGSTRIAAHLKPSALKVADDFHLVGGVSVPSRTRQRYFQALRETAPGESAEKTAAKLGMSPDVFTAVQAAIAVGSFEFLSDAVTRQSEGSYSGPGGGNNADSHPAFRGIAEDRSYATVDQAADVARAFAAVDELTEGIIKDAYGFTEYDELPDAEIAHRRGFSRQKVQRIRTAGLATMRVALVGPEDVAE